MVKLATALTALSLALSGCIAPDGTLEEEFCYVFPDYPLEKDNQVYLTSKNQLIVDFPLSNVFSVLSPGDSAIQITDEYNVTGCHNGEDVTRMFLPRGQFTPFE